MNARSFTDYMTLPETTRWVAALPSIWPESIPATNLIGWRVHPVNNRPEGDETVIARAVVYVDGSPHRLTIRAENLLATPGLPLDFAHHGSDYAALYRRTLRRVMELPEFRSVERP